MDAPGFGGVGGQGWRGGRAAHARRAARAATQPDAAPSIPRNQKLEAISSFRARPSLIFSGATGATGATSWNSSFSAALRGPGRNQVPIWVRGHRGQHVTACASGQGGASPPAGGALGAGMARPVRKARQLGRRGARCWRGAPGQEGPPARPAGRQVLLWPARSGRPASPAGGAPGAGEAHPVRKARQPGRRGARCWRGAPGQEGSPARPVGRQVLARPARSGGLGVTTECSATIWMGARVNQDDAMTARRKDDGC
jgi:hypothetical protein